jgi:FG-GAP-like repeat/FG-GAP repeat
VLIRLPGGGFVAEPSLSVLSDTSSVTAADFNGDGRVDLAAIAYGNPQATAPGFVRTFLRNPTNNGFAAEGSVTLGVQPRDVVAADFNRDGLPDLAVTNLGSGTVSVLLRQPAGGFVVEGTAIPVGASPEGIEAADFNGDGFPDLAVAILGTNTVNVLLRDPGGGFTAEAPIPIRRRRARPGDGRPQRRRATRPRGRE